MSRRSTLRPHSPNDSTGRDLRVGDWVRVVRVPDSVARMPRESKRAFARAVGKTCQIEGFNALGLAELDLTGKVGWDTIWIEPFCVQRFRRPRKRSLRFRRVLAIRRRLDRPRWSFRYVATYRANEKPARLVKRLLRFPFSHGWYVLKNPREIHGTFSAPDRTPSSKQRLKQLRKELRESGLFLSLRLARIRLTPHANGLVPL